MVRMDAGVRMHIYKYLRIKTELFLRYSWVLFLEYKLESSQVESEGYRNVTRVPVI